MTDSEIIKALECCINNTDEDCNKCVCSGSNVSCVDVLLTNALDLINCLQAENEDKDRYIKTLKDDLNLAKEDIGFKNAEIERLKTQLYLEKYTDVAKRTIKAEAYKECIEEVKKELSLIRLGCQNLLDNEGVFAIDLARKQVDNLLKELVGEQPILNDVKCIDCEYLELELPYAVCSKAYKGIVAPDDSCGKGKLKELVGEDNDL